MYDTHKINFLKSDFHVAIKKNYLNPYIWSQGKCNDTQSSLLPFLV